MTSQRRRRRFDDEAGDCGMALINGYFRITDSFPTSSSGDGFDSGIWGVRCINPLQIGGRAAFETSLQCIICHFAWQAGKPLGKVKLGKV